MHYVATTTLGVTGELNIAAVVKWANFHNLAFVEGTPSAFHEFSLTRADAEPLNVAEKNHFYKNCRYSDTDKILRSE